MGTLIFVGVPILLWVECPGPNERTYWMRARVPGGDWNP